MKSLLLSMLLATTPALAAEALHPAKIPAAEAQGAIFSRPGMVAKDGTRDVITLMTADKQFESGMYEGRPRPCRMEGQGLWRRRVHAVHQGQRDADLRRWPCHDIGARRRGDHPRRMARHLGYQGYTKYYVIRSRGAKLE